MLSIRNSLCALGVPSTVKGPPINCTGRLANINLSQEVEMMEWDTSGLDTHSFSQYFYTILTPIIVMIGLVGNILCIRIFSKRKLLRQVSSMYFAAMSAADILVLFLYVIPEWFQRGLAPLLHAYELRVIGLPAWCQVFLYTSYSMRIMSVWMLVTSTIERYIGVCHPLMRRKICSVPSAKRIIASVICASAVLTLWKPILSASTSSTMGLPPPSSSLSSFPSSSASLGPPSRRPVTPNCAAKEDAKIPSFILDALYAACLSVIPSLIILSINVSISRRLLIWRKRTYQSESDCISNQEALGIQFAALLVLISTTYLLLTWPYYICWLRQWILMSIQLLTRDAKERAAVRTEGLHGALHVTRTIFYMNYSINYFLYSFASRYFRREMKRIFTVRARRRSARNYYPSTEAAGHCRSHHHIPNPNPEEEDADIVILNA